MIPEGQIAKSYDLNILASVVGRCSARKIGNASGKQIREAHDEITEIKKKKIDIFGCVCFWLIFFFFSQ